MYEDCCLSRDFKPVMLCGTMEVCLLFYGEILTTVSTENMQTPSDGPDMFQWSFPEVKTLCGGLFQPLA